VREVTNDELCTKLVASMPMKRPTKGFEVNDSNSIRTPPPSIFRETPRRVMLKKNRYMRNGMENHRITGPTRLRIVCMASSSVLPTGEFGRTPKCVLATPYLGYRAITASTLLKARGNVHAVGGGRPTRMGEDT
jgi:hypothetical protein